MTEHQPNRERVAKAFDAFQRGDVEAVNSALDPQIEVVIADGLANAGTWHGIDGFWESVGTWLEAFDDYQVEVLGIETPDDDHVIVEARQTAKGRASGVPVELTTYFLFEMRAGITTRYELHPSRDGAMAAIAQH